jgi:hypothetical protein
MSEQKEQRNNSGSIFKNDKKGNENWPDYQGKAVVDGVEYYTSIWVKKSASGTMYMSQTFKPVVQTSITEQHEQKMQEQKQDQQIEDLPF